MSHSIEQRMKFVSSIFNIENDWDKLFTVNFKNFQFQVDDA